jgi:hypothetical protein
MLQSVGYPTFSPPASVRCPAVECVSLLKADRPHPNPCWSRYGWCGSQPEYCDLSQGCQPMYGACTGATRSAQPSPIPGRFVCPSCLSVRLHMTWLHYPHPLYPKGTPASFGCGAPLDSPRGPHSIANEDPLVRLAAAQHSHTPFSYLHRGAGNPDTFTSSNRLRVSKLGFASTF